MTKIKTFLSDDSPTSYNQLDDEVNEFTKDKHVISIASDTPQFSGRWGTTFGHKVVVVYEEED